jgi:hypothetical protein
MTQSYDCGFVNFRHWIGTEFDGFAQRFDAVPKDVFDTFFRTEKVCQHRKPAVFRFGKEYGRGISGVKAALNGGEFQIGIDRFVELDQLPGSPEIINACFQSTIAHDHPL